MNKLGRVVLVATLLGGVVMTQNVGAENLPVSEAPIHFAARQGTAAEVEAMVRSNRGLIQLRTDQGSTALHMAAMNPDLAVLRTLLAAGADPNARDADGATPLHMAAYASRPVHTRLLLEAGSDPLLKTNNGRDAAAMARKVKSDETAGVISLWLLKGCKAGKPC